MSALPDFGAFCEEACIKLWGDPDSRSAHELRWKGSDAYSGKTLRRGRGTWYDHGEKRGGSLLDLVAYSKNRPKETLRGAAFFEAWDQAHRMGLVPDPPPAKGNGKGNGGNGQGGPIVAAYDYRDEAGELLFQVVRLADPENRFRQRRSDGAGAWVWDLKGVRSHVLFRLPELIAAAKAGERILVTEGERDALTAVALGFQATTMPGGVGKCRPDYDQYFAGADVVVVSDNDPQAKDPKAGALRFHPNGAPVLPGQDHAAAVARRLRKVAAHVRVIMFDQAKDLSAWVEAGGTRAQLEAIIAAAPEYAAVQDQNEAAEPTHEPVDEDAEIDRLARMARLEYERARSRAAKKLGVRASMLDKLVFAKRADLGLFKDDAQGTAVTFPEIEPWPTAVNGAALLDEIADAVRRYVVLSDQARDAVALWIVHTWLIERFRISPKLAIRSPTRGCGKSTLIEVMTPMVRRAQQTSNITPAALFRVVQRHRPTLLIDEVDSFLAQSNELRGLLNASHKFDGAVTRTVGDDHEPRSFRVYSAVALSGIGALPETIADRAIDVELKRRLPGEPLTQLRIGQTKHLDDTARKIARWVADHADDIAAAEPELPAINRGGDNWLALFAIAHVAAGEWPKRALAAAMATSGSAETNEEGRLELVLIDIRAVFDREAATLKRPPEGDDRISSEDLAERLGAMEDRPWAEYGSSGKPITKAKLARLLGKVHVSPQAVRIGDATPRGYLRRQFEELWARYVPSPPSSKCNNATTPANPWPRADSQSATEGEPVALSKPQNPPENRALLRCCTLEEGEDAARVVADFDAAGFRIVLEPEGALAIRDLQKGDRRYARTPNPRLMAAFTEHADAIGRWLEDGGTI
jgi:putative DNA primase/helicase